MKNCFGPRFTVSLERRLNKMLTLSRYFRCLCKRQKLSASKVLRTLLKTKGGNCTQSCVARNALPFIRLPFCFPQQSISHYLQVWHRHHKACQQHRFLTCLLPVWAIDKTELRSAFSSERTTQGCLRLYSSTRILYMNTGTCTSMV